jgi:hypothetical protein
MESLDAKQDELMIATSSDGRPPSHGNRRVGWRRLGGGVAIALPCIVAWAMLTRQSAALIFAPLALLVVVCFLLAANPVLWAGVMRGKEERAARRAATLEEPPSASNAIVVGVPERESAGMHPAP